MPGLQLQPRRPLPRAARQRARHALGSLVRGHPVRRRRLGLDGGGAGEARRELLRGSSTTSTRPTRSARRPASRPIDFHIAVTTTSVFWNPEFASSFSYTCQAGVCRNSSGTALVGEDGQPVDLQPRGERPRRSGAPRAASPAAARIEHTYDFSFCTGQGSPAGVAVDGDPYPRGDFVSWSGEPARPPLRQGAVRARAKNRQGFTRQQLIDWFVGAGTARRKRHRRAPAAPARSRRSRRRGSRSRRRSTGGRRTRTPSPGRRRRTPAASAAQADWPRQNSKLVLVFVGDEDDCSSPDDPSGGIVMRADLDRRRRLRARLRVDGGDEEEAVPGRASSWTTSRASAGPLGAAFIFPAAQTSCSGTTCTPGLCCQEDCPTASVCTQSIEAGTSAAPRRPGTGSSTRRTSLPQQGRRRRHRLRLRLELRHAARRRSPRS